MKVLFCSCSLGTKSHVDPQSLGASVSQFVSVLGFVKQIPSHLTSPGLIFSNQITQVMVLDSFSFACQYVVNQRLCGASFYA